MLPPEDQAQGDRKSAFPQFFLALSTVLRNRIIVLTSLVEAAQYLVYGAIEAFLALYAASIGIPAWQVGIILGVQLVSVIAIKPVMGVLSDRFGRQTIILPGIVLGAISVGLLAHGADVVVLSLLSLVYGIAFAAVTSSTSALVADLSKRGQFGASIGVLRTIMDVGQTIGPVLTGFVVGSLGYAVAFPVLAAVLALSALLFLFLPKAAFVT
jgi:MFS family permease